MKKTRKLIVILAMCCFAMIMSVCGVFCLKAANALDTSQVEIVADLTKTTYAKGDSLEIPQGQLSYDGSLYDATAVIHFPSGDAYLTDEVKLSESGIYTLEYRATINGQLVRKFRTFEALEGIFSTTTSRSSVSYGTSENYPDAPEGVVVSLAKGDTFTLNKTINLAELDLTDTNALRMYLTPLGTNAVDAYSMYVTFTDAYDPDNYVIVSVYSQNSQAYDYWPTMVSFISACAPNSGQSYAACFYDYSNSRQTSNIVRGSRTAGGYCSDVSFYGNNGYREFTSDKSTYTFSRNIFGVGDTFISFNWNYAQRELHGEPVTIYDSNGKAAKQLSTLISDLDNTSYYSKAWNGFTTGECYVSITADDYSHTSFNFVVTEVGDLKLAADNLTFRDEAKPEITLDYGEYTLGTLPTAKVGCAYPVPVATAYDMADGDIAVSARAYYGDKVYEVTCGDTFIPDRAGKFTIEYTATDRSGNTAVERVEINVAETATALVLNVDSSGQVTSGQRGVWLDVAAAEYSGGVGELSLLITAVEKESGTSYDGTDGKFRPMVAGTYDITYTLTDYIGQTETYTYQATIANTTTPIFLETPVLPKYIISGYGYIFPALNAYDETTGKEVAADIYILDNGVESETVGGAYNPSGATRSISVIYKAKNASGTTAMEFKLPLINIKTGQSFDLTKYFDASGLTAQTVDGNDRILLKADSGATSATATFINPVLAEGFSTVFTIESGNFKELYITLTDSENENEVVRFSWKNLSGNNYLYVNGNATSAIAGFGFSDLVSSNFAWTNSTCVFTDNSTSASVTVNKTLYGEAFSGFTSGKVYITYGLVGISGDAAVSVSTINNQTIRTTRRDVISPQLSFVDGEYAAQMRLGEVLTLKDFVTADVLAPTVTATLTVTDPDGNIVTTNEGSKLDATTTMAGTISLNKLGKYRISYTVSDGGNSPLTTDYIVNVLNVNRLTITVNGEVPTEGTVGTEIALPSATAEDPTEGFKSYYILLITPRGVESQLSKDSGATFTPEVAGTYIVLYVSYDSSNNVTLNRYRITVK